MARIEYEATCLCGGPIKTLFKKPTRFQPTVVRTRCPGCSSEFLFTYSVEYANGERAYVPEHKVLLMTKKLKAALEDKKRQPKEKEVSA
jgi:hypothetical protein